MSHASQGGQAPDQASSGRQTGAAAHAQTDHSEDTHTAASHPTSHTRHGDNQAGTRLVLDRGPFKTEPRWELHRVDWTETLERLERLLT